MRKLILFTIGLSLCISGISQKVKVLEKSARKPPEWVNGIVKNYIIVSASGETAESAQSNALLRIKERIVSAIAENIQTSSEYYRGEKTVNGVTNFIENYETFTKTKAADIGFVKGISLSKAEEYYWEKVSEDGKIKYYYHIKYPFSEMQLAKLVLDFEMADKQLTEEMNTIIDSIPYIASIEQITEYMRSLQTLSKAFIDTRRQKAELYINKLNEMLRSITIYPLEEKPGELKYTLRYNDRIITTASNPRVTSNCAKITDIRNEGDEWIIRYNYSGCYDDPGNKITVAYPVSTTLRKDFSFDINANKAEILLRNDIIFTASNTTSDQLAPVQCSLTIYSKYNSPLTVETITLIWDNYPPVIVDGLQYNVRGKGEYNVSFTINQPIDKRICSPSIKNTLSGSIQYRSVTGELLTYRIYNQRFRTNW